MITNANIFSKKSFNGVLRQIFTVAMVGYMRTYKTLQLQNCDSLYSSGTILFPFSATAVTTAGVLVPSPGLRWQTQVLPAGRWERWDNRIE